VKLLKTAGGLLGVLSILYAFRVDLDHISVTRCALGVILIYGYGTLREKGWVR